MKAIAIMAAALLAFAARCGTIAADPSAAHFGIPIVKDRVPPTLRRIEVREGDRVHLLWSADEPMTVHLEGYEISITVLPGTPVAMEFDARTTGRFPVHAHSVGGQAGGHGHGHRALSHIEVHPK